MIRRTGLATVVAGGLWFAAGCTTGAGPAGIAGEVDSVASKAVSVASQIGGMSGFGGTRMGFQGMGDMASGGGMMMMLHNQSSQGCTFHVTHFSSQDGGTEQTADVNVLAGGEITVPLPCSEIVGMGPLEMPGGIGCHLADGQAVRNTMAVPGFLNMDYACGGTFHMYLQPDTGDLDANGDTQELILMSEAMQTHMSSGGPMGHVHGQQNMMSGLQGMMQ